ncbi:hypothetical protein GGQ99_003165 [Aminobacter niigataensis]|uniref:DUF4435 domain-containing protein n=1 Tax=Aminobacter niigataensis TaxID=83265 RepID=A0ABR6L3R1_9HYPH|nr:DUF4435 domain-containing protein [Aminobacter niigataensis]MBB4651398.1 hypothetical protein [Aminobacter niigataensis]
MTAELGRGKVEITVDEAIATLKRSSWPTTIIEGKDDTIVFRRLEDIFVNEMISILPVGGRDKVLAIFERRSEINRPEGIAFVTDKDSWCVSGVPTDYQSDCLLLTNGYSIENDVICDGDLLGLMTAAERSEFERELQEFLRWYALAFSRFLKGNGEVIKTHPNEVLDPAGVKVDLLADEVYPDELLQLLSEQPIQLVRGKSMFGLLMRRLSYGGRVVRHNHKALMETVAAKPGPILAALFHRVGQIVINSSANGPA